MAILERDPTVPRRYHLRSPVDGAPLGQLDATPADACQAAMARARVAAAKWAAVPVRDRVSLARRALKVLVRNQDAYAEVFRQETGRPPLETLMLEVFAACDSLNYYSLRAERVLADRSPGLHLLKTKRAKVVYEPLGVVLVITPWNGPFILSLNPTVQAILAGNAVIVKPSEVTPRSAALVQDLFRDAGAPVDLVQVVQGDGQTGADLIEAHPDKVCFTGSVRTGRRIGEACGRALIPCTLELGGKDAMIVCRDADVERAVGGALFGGMMNNGQFCAGTERVYAVDAVFDAFVAQLVERCGKLTQATSGHFDVGPFISAAQAEVVERHLAEAVARGARVLVGGQRNRAVGDLYFQPTVVVEAPHDCALVQEETFGPVLPVIRCRDEDDALRLANDCAYGLSGTVWSRDPRLAERVARGLRTGNVCVNESSLTYGVLEVPFGGVKQSGVGQVNGADGLLAFCRAKPLIIDRFGLKHEQQWHPYTEQTYKGMRRAVDVLWGTPLRRLL